MPLVHSMRTADRGKTVLQTLMCDQMQLCTNVPSVLYVMIKVFVLGRLATFISFPQSISKPHIRKSYVLTKFPASPRWMCSRTVEQFRMFLGVFIIYIHRLLVGHPSPSHLSLLHGERVISSRRPASY